MKNSIKNRKKLFFSKTVYICSLRKNAERFTAQSLAFVCLLSVFFFADCKNQNPTEIQPAAQTREISDDLGRPVKIPAQVERAVSLAPNLTETVFAVGAGEKLVGVTTFCDYPAEAQKIQKIGDTQMPNIENIIALKPQIVLVSTASQMENFSKTLERQGIAVFVTNPGNLEGVYKTVYQIGEIFGRSEKASEIVSNLKNRVADVQNRTASTEKVKVFLQISKEPLFTIGKSSFINDLIARAGGTSLTENVETAYPKISKETAVALDPDVIILSDSEDNREPNEVFKNSKAARNGKVFRVNADLIVRPAPRLVDGLEQIAKALHPESFR